MQWNLFYSKAGNVLAYTVDKIGHRRRFFSCKYGDFFQNSFSVWQDIVTLIELNDVYDSSYMKTTQSYMHINCTYAEITSIKRVIKE